MDAEASRRVVFKALDLGITFFDTADVYGKRGGSEEILGQALGARRKDTVLATKFATPMDDEGTLRGGSRRYIMSAAEASLRRLKTDWIDLYQIHRPDPASPVEETLRALDDLVRQGKVRYIGCSNHRAWQVVEAHWTALHCNLNRFISCQDEYNLVMRDAELELVPAIEAHGLGLIPYFPLAGGLLTGKYGRGGDLPSGSRLAGWKTLADRVMTPDNMERIDRLRAFAEARGHTLLELAFAWLMSRPTVACTIAGASSSEQLESNLKSASWRFSVEDLLEFDESFPGPRHISI
jgi:aryl-alcohol dehydrogenase-like predicted oxidoreductase